jgi:arginine decarboxylase
VILLADRKLDEIISDPPRPASARVLRDRGAARGAPLDPRGVAERFETPYFDNLQKYAQKPVGTFHALPIARGKSIFRSNWIRDMGEFYGPTLFLAESSATTGGLDSLLEPTGTSRGPGRGRARLRRGPRVLRDERHVDLEQDGAPGAARAGDIVIVDRNCHKSHHYGMVLAGAQPYYVEAFPLVEYSMYGAVPCARSSRRCSSSRPPDGLDKVKLITLTNCTFDGHVYDTRA